MVSKSPILLYVRYRDKLSNEVPGLHFSVNMHFIVWHNSVVYMKNTFSLLTKLSRINHYEATQLLIDYSQ